MIITRRYLYPIGSRTIEIKKAAIEKRVRKLGETSGIGRRVYPHLIRHTIATDGLDRGMPVEEVQQILGHVNIATTMIYAEVSKANVKNDHRCCLHCIRVG